MIPTGGSGPRRASDPRLRGHGAGRARGRSSVGAIILGLWLPAPGLAAQEPGAGPPPPDTRFAPSPAHPFGRPHPQAPPELEQFAFMIGEFDCEDEIRRSDGSTLRFPAIWNARYFLNGFGIQDEYWTPRFYTSNIRIYDPDAARWKITFFRMPGYQSGVWEGGLEGERLVFRQGTDTGPGLTFHDITEDGFEWHSGGPNPAWTSSCRRRR